MKGRPKGYKPTEEQIANMRKPRKNTEGMKGKPKSEETKAKMLVAQQIRRAREKQAKGEIHNNK